MSCLRLSTSTCRKCRPREHVIGPMHMRLTGFSPNGPLLPAHATFALQPAQSIGSFLIFSRRSCPMVWQTRRTGNCHPDALVAPSFPESRSALETRFDMQLSDLLLSDHLHGHVMLRRRRGCAGHPASLDSSALSPR